MEYSNPETALLQVQASNPILGNPLLLAAILLFLAILPRALRHILSQKEKTALDRMVERFEDDELETSAKKESDESNTPQEKPATPPKDSSLAYLMEDTPTSEVTPVKVVKEGVPISHNKETDFSLASKKKIKLIKQGSPIPLGESKEALTKASAESLKNKSVAQGQKSKQTGSPVSEPENEEPDNNWVEAEIPGLIMDNAPAPEKPESIPTFKASPKVKHPAEVKTSPIPPTKEKQRPKAKNIAPNSEEIKDTKPKKYVKTKMDSLELQMEISEPKPKTVEIKDAIASHKDRDQKTTGQKKAMVPSVKIGKPQKTEPEVTAVPPQREDMETSPEKIKPKPFLLDLKYLDQEALETADPVAGEKLHDDVMDAVITRLNDLQVDLENQLVSIPGELTAIENSINGSMRKDRTQSSVPDLEGTINDPSDKKEVTLEELDSFLFTATQRRK
jgi:hypothetical protein